MRKSPFLFFSICIFSAFFIFGKFRISLVNPTTPMSLGNPDDKGSWYAWNLSRLADPATGKIPVGIREAELEFASRLPINLSRSNSWTQIGPRDLGGRTRAAAFDVRNDSIVIAGGVTGGLWKSTNAMGTFFRTTNSLQIQSVTSIRQDIRPGHEDTWYAGTGEYYGIASISSFSSIFSGNGIYKSTDNGETWNLLPSTVSNTPETGYRSGDMDYVWNVVVDYTDTINDVVLAAVYNGVYRSTDGGATWTAVLGEDTTTTATSDYCDIIMTPSGVFYAALSSDSPKKGIYRSDDGVSWTKINIVTGWPGTYNRFVMDYNPFNNNEVTFLGETPSSGTAGHNLWRYTYLSGDGSGTGGSWQNLSANIPDKNCTGFFTANFSLYSSQSGFDMFIKYHPTIDSLLFIGGTNIYRSTDAFRTDTNWRWIGGYRCNTADLSDYVYPNHHPDQHGLTFFNSNPYKALSFNDGGLYVADSITADSVFWQSANNSYITSQFYTVAMETGNVMTNFLVGGAQDNGTWFTNANHVDSLWKWIGRGDGSFAAIPEGRAYYILSTQQGKMYKVAVDNYGDTTLLTRIDPNKSSLINFINPFIIDPSDNRRVYMIQNYKIFRNHRVDTIQLTGNKYDTIARSWKSLPLSTTSTLLGNITTLEMSAAMPHSLIYGTSKSKVYKMIHCDENSSTRIGLGSSVFPANAYVSSISVSPFDSLQVLVTFSNYKIPSIFFSSDGGVTFTDISGNLEQNPDGTGSGPAVYWGEIYPSWPATLFVGTSTGLYSTTLPSGASTVWTQEGSGTIGNINVNMITSRPFDGKIAISTHGAGFYTAYMPPTYLGMNPLKPELFASLYPNPVSDQFSIDYVPQVSENCELSFYSISGQLISTQTISKNNVGTVQRFSSTVSQSGLLNAGTYIAVVRNGTFRKSFKFIVRK